MKITRHLLTFFALIAPLFLSTSTRTAENPPAKQKYFVYLGNYTAKTDSKGIYLFEFSTDTGQLTAKGIAAETSDPSWVVVHPNGKFLYAANESGKASTITAFSIDAKTGKLAFLNKLPTLGEDPCYLSVDKTGKYLLVANYTSGNVVVFPIATDGSLGQHTALETDPGPTGPNKDRQDHPHAHWIEPSASNLSVYVADLGLDRILFYDFNPAKGTLAMHDATVSPRRPFGQNSLELKPGTGPRHVVIAPAYHNFRQFIYVLGELDSTVTVFGDSKEGILGPVQKISTLPADFTGRNDAAEIAILPNGKFLYTSNRGHDSIAVFTIDPAAGTLTKIDDVPTGGKEPRNFVIDPTGHYLLAENQNTNTIVEFKIDPSTGKLTETGEVIQTPSPTCIAFLPEH
jgi:6-phosphogluconolactonase